MFRLASLLVFSQIYYARLAPTENYPHSASLTSTFMLYWKYNDTHITFETHVNALGYTSFGICMTDAIIPADVIVGNVSNNVPYLADYHATSLAAPILDKSQDWVLISGEIDHGSTVLKFSRALDTHDDADDTPIHAGVRRVVWAYTENHPEVMAYHFKHRGDANITFIAKDTVPVGK